MAWPSSSRCRSDRKDARNEVQGKSADAEIFVRALSFSAVTALTLNPALTPVVASDYRAVAPVAADGQMNARFLSLGIGKSIVIDLPREIKDVLVADPKIANAVVRSTQRAYIIGAAVGQTNIIFFDAAGQQIAAYDIAVKRDLNGVRAALKQSLPNSDIQIDGVGDAVVLSGTAATPVEAQQAADIAKGLVGGVERVVNPIAVRGRDQVMLKVTVAEVARNIVKQMGIDLSASMTYGTAVVTRSDTAPPAGSAPETRIPGVDLQPGHVEWRDRLGDLQIPLGLEMIVDVQVQTHLRTGAGAECAEQIAHRLQRLAVDVELWVAWRAAEAGPEVGQLLAIERQDVGFQSFQSAPLHLGAQRGNIVVGAQRRHAHQLVVAHAVRPAMRPVHRDALAHRAAEQFVHRDTERLALDVEQRVLDRRDCARFTPPGACTWRTHSVEAIRCTGRGS